MREKFREAKEASQETPVSGKPKQWTVTQVLEQNSETVPEFNQDLNLCLLDVCVPLTRKLCLSIASA